MIFLVNILLSEWLISAFVLQMVMQMFQVMLYHYNFRNNNDFAEHYT
jgi:hypothetical protein